MGSSDGAAVFQPRKWKCAPLAWYKQWLEEWGRGLSTAEMEMSP